MFKIRQVSKSFAKRYYREEELDPPEWLGDGSKRLGLDQFDEKDFEDLLNNPLAGNKIAGWEITLSPPKSVSVKGLVGNGQDVLGIDREAMKETVSEAEKLIRTQIRNDGKKVTQDSGNGIFAAFSHGTNREDEPQKHTHIFMLNATWAKDKWRAINEIKLYKLQRSLTEFYRDSLIDKLINRGYQIYQTQKAFEIKGYSEEQLRAFSTRRHQIVREVGEDATSKAKRWAALKTRSPKSYTPRAQLKPWWEETAKAVAIQHPIPSLDATPRILLDHHYDELIDGSGIDAELASMNFESMEGNEVLERLCYHKTPETGWATQYWTGALEKALGYWRDSSVYDGGFWCMGGVDAQDLKTDSLWGSFKADTPRTDKVKNKAIKYEHPLGKNTRKVFLLKVPNDIADKIYSAHNIAPDSNKTFWENIRDSDAPIEITEGAKKTASLLSHGVIAIGVPGINATYRTTEHGRELHPDLKVFANGRPIIFAFDQDSKIETQRDVRRETVRGAELIAQLGSPVHCRKWLWKQGKGADDFIVKNSGQSYRDRPLVPWTKESKIHWKSMERRLRKASQKKADPHWVDLGVAYLAISRYGLEDAVKIMEQMDSIKGLEYRERVEAIANLLTTLDQRLAVEAER